VKYATRAYWRQWLSDRPNLHRMGANAGWLFVDKALRLPVALIVSIALARYLGPDRQGVLAYAIAFAGLFSVVAGLGLDGITVRELLATPQERDRVLGTSFLLKLLGGAASLVITLIAIVAARPGDTAMIGFVAIIAAGTLFQAFDVADYYFQSQIQSKYTVFATAPVFFALSALKIVLVVVNAPLVAFVWASFADIALASLSVAIMFRSRIAPFSQWRFIAARAKTMLSDSWPLALSAAVGMLYLRIDQVMLGQMLGDEEVGVYMVAVRIAEILMMSAMVIYSSTLPSILEARHISDELFYERVQKLYNLMALMGYAVAIPVTIFSHWIITGLFGESYARAAPMLVVLTWASVITNLGIARSAFITAMNWTRLHFASAVFAALANVLLNLWLIPLYGGVGAAFASLAAYWIGAHGVCFVFKPLHKTGWMMTKALVWPKIW
jgi:O-antigen/teichoic acid export membrane protein